MLKLFFLLLLDLVVGAVFIVLFLTLEGFRNTAGGSGALFNI